MTQSLVLAMTENGAGALDLLERARRGDSAAFERLMGMHERRVLRLALRLAGHLEDAQDISQDVFLKLHRELGRFREAPDLAAWLTRVTVNTSRDYKRKKKRSRLVPIDDAPAAWQSSLPSPERIARQSQDVDMLQAGLETLGQGERVAIVLREIEGLSTSEVASTLGLAESTVRVQICTARVKLRKFFDDAQRKRA
ncbi:MAG: RNA polymerase sigma factor [Bryobacteraceae bacterium]